MQKTATITCLECDTDLDVEMVSEEWSEYADIPETCPSCGAALDCPAGDDRQAERRQMGMTD